MNKKLFFNLAFLCFVLVFSACKNDDEKISFAGTYSGKLDVSLAGGPSQSFEQKIVLTGAENTYHLKLENFNFTDEISVPVIEIPANITEEGKVTGSVQDMELSINFGESTGMSITAESITLSGNITNENATLNILVKAPLTPGATPIDMDIKFSGKKQ